MAKVPQDLDNASTEELKDLVQMLLQEVAALKREVAGLQEENARLKGKPPRPDIKPSGMAENAASRGKPTGKGRSKPRGRGRKRSRLTIDADCVLKPANVPAGARFKGYEDYVVQDLEVRTRTIRYRRERWELPDGTTLTANLPAGTRGHYGGELQRLVLSLYHGGQMTIPRLTRLLNDIGVVIESRQVRRLLTETTDGFLQEAQDVLRAGLATAPWISVDDTGARHKARNGYCTQIGDGRFTAFATTGAKSRLNFLEILRAGHTDYAINAEALAYTRDVSLHRMTSDQWHAVIETNLNSCFNMCRAVIDGMRQRGFGRVVNISSINGQKGQIGQTNYAAAKAGVLGFTKALALETVSKGITVNAVAPGYVETDMVAAVPKESLQKIVAQVPVGRLGQPGEIARAVCFLVSEEAAFVTGATLTINGGQYVT